MIRNSSNYFYFSIRRELKRSLINTLIILRNIMGFQILEYFLMVMVLLCEKETERPCGRGPVLLVLRRVKNSSLKIQEHLNNLWGQVQNENMTYCFCTKFLILRQ